MFDGLAEKFDNVFKKIRGESRLTEDNIREAMREVRLALLEADVNVKVVRDFMKAVTEKAVGQDTLTQIRPAQQIIKVVHDELVHMLGDETVEFKMSKGGFNSILLLGLQGSGKTTFAGKLSAFCLKAAGFKPMLVACDVYRPAAIQQLHIVGKAVGVPVFDLGTEVPATEIARRGMEEAKKRGCDLCIIDTAGRLHIDEVKMDELVEIKRLTKPHYTFLVADAMTGQDAVNSASIFHEAVGIDGVCLTKIDGDARGGAALSIRAVTQKPIYFIGTGEKLEDLEPFHPERIAQRILGMGDIISLVERAQDAFDEKEALEMQKKLKKESFSLQDFLDQMQRVKKMGSLSNLLKMIPGMGAAMKDMPIDDDAFKPMEAMIRSMTPEEREFPEIIDGARRKRIAAGSGTTPADLNALLSEFEQTRKMMGRAMRGEGLGAMMGQRQRPGSMPRRTQAQGNDPLAVKNKPKHRRIRKTKKKR